jgi:hypothetical protein
MEEAPGGQRAGVTDHAMCALTERYPHSLHPSSPEQPQDIQALLLGYVSVYLNSDFPGLVSYGRFVELSSQAATPLLTLLTSLLGQPTLANFVDSTTLKVCHNHETINDRCKNDEQIKHA